jgi:hypothetical protein
MYDHKKDKNSGSGLKDEISGINLGFKNSRKVGILPQNLYI